MALEAPRLSRLFLPNDFSVTTWPELEPYFIQLAQDEPASLEELELWLRKRSELDAALQEDLGWRYIRQTCDTENEEKRNALYFFIQEIEPHLAEYANIFNGKLLNSPFVDQLNKEKYGVYLRNVRTERKIFREENIPLLTQIQALSNEYGQISGAMTVEIDGKTLTFQQAANLLKSPDREIRRSTYEKINQRRLQDKDRLEELFDKLLKLRHQVAVNAGFKNFRDYMFSAMGRFDYDPQACFDFHDSVEKHIVPFITKLEAERKAKLGLNELYPWDLDVDPANLPPLKPHNSAEELISRSIKCFSRVNPLFGEVLALMQEKGHLDLDSRIGKAPGGYNYPLYQSGLPFIFMNSAGSFRDMVTMMHEGGHAIHSWLSRDLELSAFKHTPSEIAEVASMAMELISMEYWDVFFPNANDLKRAKIYQLEKILGIFPWIATVDAFQHWVYEHPEHTRNQRREAWVSIHRRFSGTLVNYNFNPDFESWNWHRQLHIFEVPFYYIEYGIAQLGAIGIWKNYRQNPSGALQGYQNALALGNLRTLPELYETAGIRFDFSPEHVKGLVTFLQHELEKLKN